MLTFLFTDIEGSTALLRRLGDDAYSGVLADHHALIRSGVAAHGGKEIDTQGDAFFAVFSSPSACVAAVIDMQRSLAAHPPGAARTGGNRSHRRCRAHPAAVIQVNRSIIADGTTANHALIRPCQ